MYIHYIHRMSGRVTSECATNQRVFEQLSVFLKMAGPAVYCINIFIYVNVCVYGSTGNEQERTYGNKERDIFNALLCFCFLTMYRT